MLACCAVLRCEAGAALHWMAIGPGAVLLLCLAELVLDVSGYNPRPPPGAECTSPPSRNRVSDRRTNKTHLRVAHYNTCWLFLRRAPSGSGSELECPGACAWATEPDADLHLKRIAAEIASLDADIVSLAEVQDCYVLRELLAAMPPDVSAGYAPYLAVGDDTALHQNVGFLSRVDPVARVWHARDRASYPVGTCGGGVPPAHRCAQAAGGGWVGVAKNYVARLRIAGLDRHVSVFGVHFVAKPLDGCKCLKREAQVRGCPLQGLGTLCVIRMRGTECMSASGSTAL